jgi:hypothetical protein
VLAAPSRLLAASWLLWPVVSAGLYSLGDRRETVLTYGLAAVMAAQLLAYLWIVFRGRGSALWGFGFSGAMLAAVILDNDLGWWAYVVFGLGVLGVWCGAPLLGSAWLMAAMHPQAWMPAGGVVWLVLGFALARVVPVFGVVALPALLLPVVAHLHLAWVCGGAERSVEPS